MTLNVKDWHFRFQQQALWTAAIRQHLLARYATAGPCRVLEVGCGTGVITSHLYGYAQFSVWGIDLNLHYLKAAREKQSGIRYAGADALRLPFPTASFDLVVCHFFLLWIPKPEQALAEMARAAKPNGGVIAFAEPDYGGRIDYPPPLEELGKMQAESLARQGANPRTGRVLSGLFHDAGLLGVETGLLGGQWSGTPSPQQQESEWQTLKADLGEGISPTRLEALRRLDAQAWRSGQRVLFVPTFYAAGRKP
jgi:ubiquinone/menaquinone biosynthesis C-methylase UbiE